jgi:hypothetical protein
MINSLPQSAQSVIDAYWKLKAAENVYVRCPYFRNPRSGRDRWGLTAYSGKGSPQEIEDELRIIEKLENVDFSGMQESEIRDIMRKRKLGIECSGFIVRVLDAWTKEFYKKPVYSLLNFKKSGLGWLYSKLRPFTHVDVETLVLPKNAREVEDMQSIVPGDIIRFNTTIDHAIIVTATERDDSSVLRKIHYAHSVLEDSGEGVKSGLIEVSGTNKNGSSLWGWQESPDTGHTINEKGSPRIYRLHIMNSSL